MRPEAEVRTLAELCLLRGRTHASRPAVADDDGVLTYAELAELATAAARRLAAHGVGPGTRVALQGRNSTRWVVAAFGALVAGAALVPIGHGASPAERDGVLDGLGPAVLVHDDDLPPVEGVLCLDLGGITRPDAGVPAPRTEPGGIVPQSAPALVLSSSGTTGAVKSVPMTHGQLLRMYGELGATMRIRETDRILVAVPLAHSFGFNGLLLVAMISGAMVRVLPTYDRSVVAAVARDDALTVLAGPPTVYHDLADSGPLPDARIAIAGGQVVPVAELVEVARSLGVAEVVVGYGMTETCGTVAVATIPVARPEKVARMAPMSGVEVVVRDELDHSVTGEAGRILVRGYNLARPYGDVPDLLPDGWFDTGDLGVLDPDGRLTVVGRRSDMVIVSGFNVHPRDVETVLAAHPEVAQVAVTGIPDPRRGQRLVACVVPRTTDLDLDLVEEFARERLSAYKLPAAYVVVQQLPVTSTGKLARTALREIAERGMAAR